MKLLFNLGVTIIGCLGVVLIIALVLLCPIIVIGSIILAFTVGWAWIFAILLVSIPIAIIQTIKEWAED